MFPIVFVDHINLLGIQMTNLRATHAKQGTCGWESSADDYFGSKFSFFLCLINATINTRKIQT